MEESDILKKPQEDEYFIKILNRYEKLVFSICYRMTKNYFDAEDLTQETFLALYKALPAFDRANPKAFVTRIATNKCLDYLKRAERRVAAADEEELINYPSGESGPEKILLEKELTDELHRACKGLKPPYNEVALAYYCGGQTAVQIAASQGKKDKDSPDTDTACKGNAAKTLEKGGDAMTHINEERMQAFAEGFLSGQEELEMMGHIAQCNSCAVRFAEMMSKEKLVSPPPDLKKDILRQTVYHRSPIQVVRGIQERKRERQREFLAYSVRVVFAMTASVLIVFAISVNTDSRLREMPVEMVQMQQPEKSKAEKNLISDSLQRASGRMGDALQGFLTMLNGQKEEERE